MRGHNKERLMKCIFFIFCNWECDFACSDREKKLTDFAKAISREVAQRIREFEDTMTRRLCDCQKSQNHDCVRCITIRKCIWITSYRFLIVASWIRHKMDIKVGITNYSTSDLFRLKNDHSSFVCVTLTGNELCTHVFCFRCKAALHMKEL